jgi:hypothetical protein
VDISQPVVTKLLDRGTTQAIGIVTDVGAFLPMIVQHLEKMTTPTRFSSMPSMPKMKKKRNKN